MTNTDIANAFQELGKLMELHGENPFKIRSYQTAYRTIKGMEKPLSEISGEERQSIKGIGKAIAGKIDELLDKGQMATLERYRSQTPPGIVDLLSLKGIGPKKLAQVWKELQVEDAGELLYACHENRLVDLKGFGAKTQADWISKLQFLMANRGKKHLAKVWDYVQQLKRDLQATFPQGQVAIVGGVARQDNVVSAINYLTTISMEDLEKTDLFVGCRFEKRGQELTIHQVEKLPIIIEHAPEAGFVQTVFERNSSTEFLKDWYLQYPTPTDQKSVEAYFESLQVPYIIPPVRVEKHADYIQTQQDLIKATDIQGVVHAHSTWSDGSQSIEAMAKRAKELGYSYLLMTDHSRTAVYANGLQVERLQAQWAEIDTLNTKLKGFRILKGIESDILRDGSLDYEDEVLAQFDVIIASVHSGLKMDQETATARLIKAIENPYCHILGHPTGRLLLAREGYPLDFEKIIDACAANGVAIEINANPYRLDLDAHWIPLAMEKGVKICINPDAHSLQGIQDIQWGVLAAQRGGLSKEYCLNAGDVDAFLGYWGKVI